MSVLDIWHYHNKFNNYHSLMNLRRFRRQFTKRYTHITKQSTRSGNKNIKKLINVIIFNEVMSITIKQNVPNLVNVLVFPC